MDIDNKYGNKNGVFETSDMDAFYLKTKGWTPTATNSSDSSAMYYSNYHAAKSHSCGCMGPKTVFESKLGSSVKIEHIHDQLNGSTYGSPNRFYK